MTLAAIGYVLAAVAVGVVLYRCWEPTQRHERRTKVAVVLAAALWPLALIFWFMEAHPMFGDH